MNLIEWPKKKREFFNHHIDSTIWNDFNFREDDIIIASYAKSGTTWVQQIVAQLLWNGMEDLDVAKMSPWLDFRFPSKKEKLLAVETQQHRRFLKTHLPLDALVFSPKAKYIYIARDGRDVVWSLYNHHANANEKWYQTLNNTPGRVGPPIEKPPLSIRQYFEDWLKKNGYPFWPYWENIRSWWEIRHFPNVLLIHFADLKRDFLGQIVQIAKFLKINIDKSRLPKILDHCSFDYMKRSATNSVPFGGIFWKGGANTFIYKGTNGRWRKILTESDLAKYEEAALKHLGTECFHWLTKD